MSENGRQDPVLSKSFYRIGEVGRLTDTKPFVLRYWETEFPTLQPTKSAKGQRLYRSEDVETVLRIKRLLYDEGFTIAGARRHLRETGGSPLEEDRVGGMPPSEPPTVISRKVLLDLRDALRALLTLLESE